MLSGLTPLQIVLAVVGIGFLIAWHEAGHYLVARLCGMRVLRYSLGFGPALFSFERGGIVYQLAALPLGGFVQIFGMNPLEEGAADDPRSYGNRPRWARFAVVAAGPLSNYLLAALLFFSFLLLWPAQGPGLSIGEVSPGSAAAEAGVLSGDLVVEIDGARVDRQDFDVGAVLQAKQGSAIPMAVLRGPPDARVRVPVVVTPKQVDGAWRMGVTYTYEAAAMELPDMVRASVVMTLVHSKQTLAAFGGLFAGDQSVKLEGPVNIVGHITKAIDRGLRDVVWILALLSTTLGLLNLLPVPALDGMKMLTLVVEGVLRRDVNPVLQVWVNAVGLVLLLGLMLVLTVVEGAQKLFG